MEKISISKGLDSTIKWLEFLQLISICGVVLLVFFQIVIREVFSVGVAWIYEIARFFQVTLVYLGVPILLRRNENVQILVIYDALPPKVQKILAMIQFIICFITVALLMISNYFFLSSFYNVKTATLGIPNIVFFFSTAVGLIISFLVLVEKFIIKIREVHSK
ncbi:MAG: TRAP transporter small permease subunit [Spirochaetales bacterium]